MIIRRAFVLTIGILLVWPVSSWPNSITQLVVFGDSLSDTGNISALGLGLYPAAPSYTAGEFTDGPDTAPSTTGPVGVWDQQLSKMMSLPSPTPFLGDGGSNYAFGGALTGDNPSCLSCNLIPDVGDQVTFYLASHLGHLPSTSLYTFWAGANDILHGLSPQSAVANLTGDINTLYRDGARNFLWLNMPPLGDTPHGLGSGDSAGLNALSEEYNSDWLQAIATLDGQDPGIDITGVNTYGLVEAMIADPSAYHFTNVTTPAQGQNVNPDSYLFWDSLHPTTEGHYWVASLAYQNLDPPGNLDAPEPPVALLLATGLLGALIVLKRREQRPGST